MPALFPEMLYQSGLCLIYLYEQGEMERDTVCWTDVIKDCGTLYAIGIVRWALAYPAHPLRVERVRSVENLRIYHRSQVSIDLSQAQLASAKAIQTYMETGAVRRQDVRPLLKRLKKSERNT